MLANTEKVRQPRPIRALVVDDSPLVCKLLTEMINDAADMQVVGTAADPYEARECIKRLNPDVLTLDIEMPRMDGITFLHNLMRLRPMPVVMVSSYTRKGAAETLRALDAGAFDFMQKPSGDMAHVFPTYRRELQGKLRRAVGAKSAAEDIPEFESTLEIDEKFTADAIIAQTAPETVRTANRIIAIGASTGGTEAIKEVVSRFPAGFPGTVVTQHIPANFSEPFAARLDSLSAMNVSQAKDGEEILPGHVYVAPGDRHLLLKRVGQKYYCKLDDGVAVNRHKPSVDVLFRSVAQHSGRNASGILLTGMGADGAQGLKELRQAGCLTIAQDEKTSVVWGMPGSAVKLGAVDEVLPLDTIAERMIDFETAQK